MMRTLQLLSLSFLISLIAACGGCSSDPGEIDDVAPEMVAPDSIQISAPVTESAETDVSIENVGSDELTASFSADANWLSVSPNELSVTAGSEGVITIYAECGDQIETRHGEVEIASNDPRAEQTALSVDLSCEAVEPGGLTVTVEGLPEGLDADIAVSGPDDFSESLTESTTFEDLRPGSYELLAEPVDGDLEYLPSPSDQSVEVSSGETAQATVTYGAIPGNLEITFTGLPAGESGEASVEGPAEFATSVSGNETLAAIAPGSYDIIPADIEVGEAIFEADMQTVDVISDETTSVEISYEGPPGAIELEVLNLPENADPTIELADATGELVDEFPTDGLLTDIPAGDYTVIPDDYTTNGENYLGAEVEVTVTAGVTETVEIFYNVESGNLAVTVDGLPEGMAFDIDLVNEQDQSTSLTSSGEMTLSPGTYRLVPNPVQVDLETYEADDVDDIEITSGNTTEETVTYEVILAALVLDSQGLDDGLEMRAEITDGPDSSSLIGEDVEGPGPHPFEEVLPGSYTVDFKLVTESNDFTANWEPEPSLQTYDVPSGETVTALTTYTVQPGDLTVTIDIPEDIEVPEGDTYAIDFDIERQGQVVETITTDGPTTFEMEAIPGAYEVTVDEPITDKWGNEFIFDGLHEPVNLSSQGERTLSVTAAHPTQVTTEVDDPTLYGSLRAIIERVQPNTEITFAANIDEIELLEGSLSLAESVHILGENTAKVTLIPTSDAHRHFTIDADDKSAEVSLQGLILEGGDAGSESGGAVQVASDLGELTIHGVDLVENQAEHGGAVAIDGDVDEALLEEVSFVNNSAQDQGGALAIRAEADPITVVDAQFEDNSSETGGALYVNSAQGMLIVDDATFANNTATSAGGGFFSAGEMIAELHDVSFESNASTSDSGGAIAAEGALFAHRLVAIDNTANQSGGALWLTPTAEVVIDEAHLRENQALQGGAIYLQSGGDLELRRALVQENSATNDGGGAYLIGDAHVENTTFSANSANNDGGGLFFHEASVVTLHHCTIVENSANDGHGIWTDDTDDAALGGTYITNNGAADGQQIEGPAGFLFTGIGEGEAIASLGYNFISEVGDYFDDESTDIVGESSNYNALEDLGGFSETHAIVAGQHGYLDIPAADCRTVSGEIMGTDQRRSPRPSGAECSRGAWEVDAHIEDFEAADFDETSQSGAFNGVDGRLWNYHQIRSAGAFAIDGEGARSDTEGASVSSSAIDGIDGPVESFSVQYRKAGTDDNRRQIRVRVNGSTVGSSSEFGDFTGEDDTIHVLELPDFDEGTGFELEVENSAPDGSGDITIDNITWR